MRIAILGSSTSILTVEAGKFIDSCDLVIRLNWGLWRREPVDNIGTKIDIWAYGLNGTIYPRFCKDVNGFDCSKIDLWWVGDFDENYYKEHGARQKYQQAFLDNHVTRFRSSEALYESRLLAQKHGIHRPTTGLIVIKHVLENCLKDTEIYIGGFGVEDQSYENMSGGNNHFKEHTISKEDALISSWVKDGLIRRLENISSLKETIMQKFEYPFDNIAEIKDNRDNNLLLQGNMCEGVYNYAQHLQKLDFCACPSCYKMRKDNDLIFVNDNRKHPPKSIIKSYHEMQPFLQKEIPKLGNSVFVVGSGSSLTGRKLGSIIDECDFVIRMNWAMIKGYEEDVGTHTDAYATSSFKDIPSDVRVQEVYNLTFEYMSPYVLIKKDRSFLPLHPNCYRMWKNLLQTYHLSTGMACVAFAVSMFDDVKVAGFHGDEYYFEKTHEDMPPKYYDNTTITAWHQFAIEDQWIQFLDKHGYLSIMDKDPEPEEDQEESQEQEQ